MNPTDFAITTDLLTRRFGKRNAVDGISLAVPRGAIYGFIGLNGAGKSTTIRMLLGLLAPTSGTVHLNGVNVAFDPVGAKARVGYVPDRPTAYPWMRVQEVIQFCEGVFPDWSPTLASSLLKKYRIDPRAKVSKLSKGTGAKLSLLLALAHDPQILILDEPTDGLDPIARDEFFEEVLRASLDSPRTVLISSHSLQDIQRATDHLGFLHEGRLIFQGRTDELLGTTKRVRLLPESPIEDAALRRLSPDVSHIAREGRAVTVTLRNFSPAAAESLRTFAHSPNLEVADLSLDDAFKDIVKGMEATCS